MVRGLKMGLRRRRGPFASDGKAYDYGILHHELCLLASQFNGATVSTCVHYDLVLEVTSAVIILLLMFDVAGKDYVVA